MDGSFLTSDFFSPVQTASINQMTGSSLEDRFEGAKLFCSGSRSTAKELFDLGTPTTATPLTNSSIAGSPAGRSLHFRSFEEDESDISDSTSSSQLVMLNATLMKNSKSLSRTALTEPNSTKSMTLSPLPSSEDVDQRSSKDQRYEQGLTLRQTQNYRSYNKQITHDGTTEKMISPPSKFEALTDLMKLTDLIGEDEGRKITDYANVNAADIAAKAQPKSSRVTNFNKEIYLLLKARQFCLDDLCKVEGKLRTSISRLHRQLVGRNIADASNEAVRIIQQSTPTSFNGLSRDFQSCASPMSADLLSLIDNSLAFDCLKVDINKAEQPITLSRQNVDYVEDEERSTNLLCTKPVNRSTFDSQSSVDVERLSKWDTLRRSDCRNTELRLETNSTARGIVRSRTLPSSLLNSNSIIEALLASELARVGSESFVDVSVLDDNDSDGSPASDKREVTQIGYVDGNIAITGDMMSAEQCCEIDTPQSKGSTKLQSANRTDRKQHSRSVSFALDESKRNLPGFLDPKRGAGFVDADQRGTAPNLSAMKRIGDTDGDELSPSSHYHPHQFFGMNSFSQKYDRSPSAATMFASGELESRSNCSANKVGTDLRRHRSRTSPATSKSAHAFLLEQLNHCIGEEGNAFEFISFDDSLEAAKNRRLRSQMAESDSQLNLHSPRKSSWLSNCLAFAEFEINGEFDAFQDAFKSNKAEVISDLVASPEACFLEGDRRFANRRSVKFQDYSPLEGGFRSHASMEVRDEERNEATSAKGGIHNLVKMSCFKEGKDIHITDEYANAQLQVLQASSLAADTADLPFEESSKKSLTSSTSGIVLDNQLVLHAQGSCKPCAFFYNKKKGCNNGESCEFCHHADHAKLSLKQWKKQQQRNLKNPSLTDSRRVSHSELVCSPSDEENMAFGSRNGPATARLHQLVSQAHVDELRNIWGDVGTKLTTKQNLKNIGMSSLSNNSTWPTQNWRAVDGVEKMTMQNWRAVDGVEKMTMQNWRAVDSAEKMTMQNWRAVDSAEKMTMPAVNALSPEVLAATLHQQRQAGTGSHLMQTSQHGQFAIRRVQPFQLAPSNYFGQGFAINSYSPAVDPSGAPFYNIDRRMNSLPSVHSYTTCADNNINECVKVAAPDQQHLNLAYQWTGLQQN